MRTLTLLRLSKRDAVSALLVLAIALTAGRGTLIAQQGKAESTAAKKLEPQYKLVVKGGKLKSISLKAKDAALSEIAADLSARLKVPVVTSPLFGKHRLSVDFTELTLEPALQLLSPQVFVDYRVEGPEQIPIGIFLYGYNEAPPATNAIVKGTSEAILIEGDTEDGVEPATDAARKRIEANPLRIELERNKLTIRANKQPLVVVLLRLGSELGIPVELRDEPTELITKEIVGVPTEEAIQRLSSNITLYVRADLQRLERTLLRLVLTPPASRIQSSTARQQ